MSKCVQALVAMAVCVGAQIAVGQTATWHPASIGPNGGTRIDTQSVRALITWDHDGNAGTSDVLMVGGNFNHTISSNETSGLLVYNGSTYSMIGAGFYSGSNPGKVLAFAVDPSDGNLIVGGEFDTVYASGTTYSSVGNIGKLHWNSGSGTWSWIYLPSTNGTEYTRTVNAIAVFQSSIYAGLTNGGGHSGLVKYDSINDEWDDQFGSDWALGTGSYSVFALYVGYPAGTTEESDPFPDPVLMVGGDFLLTGSGDNTGLFIPGAAYWDGSDFVARGASGFGGGVVKAARAFVTYGADVAVGGTFTHVNQVDDNDSCPLTSASTDTTHRVRINNLAKRTGTNWGQFFMTHTRWSGTDSTVNALAVWRGNLVFGGSFTNAVLHSDPEGEGNDNDNQVCYSDFLEEVTGLGGIGYYNNGLGTGVYAGLGGIVYALAVYGVDENGDDVLYAGGDFTIGSSPTRKGLAFWGVAEDICGKADVGGPGGETEPDGILDNNDFIAFITLFFNSDPLADLGSAGGLPGADNAWNNNDFIVFINFFFSGCPEE